MKTNIPEVRLGKITLREILPTDYMDYFELGSDPLVVEHLNWGPFNNPREALWTINEVFYKRPLDGLPVGYAIVMNGKMIGMIDYHTYNRTQNSCEIGYSLNRSYWGKGIMTRCLKMVMQIGFEHLELNKLIVGHTEANIRSKNVILKCGFRYEHQAIVQGKNGSEIGYFYSLYKQEYKGGM